MTTSFSTRLTGFFTAMVLTVSLNAGMLYMFNLGAQDEPAQATVLSLDTVTIVAKRV